jgi:hypothetical protein
MRVGCRHPDRRKVSKTFILTTLAKMDKIKKTIERTIVKYLKVLAPGYGIIYTIHSLGSICSATSI